jgi:hypothetical protein
MMPEAKHMSQVLHHPIKHSEYAARTAMYRFLFNAGVQALAFLGVLLVVLILLSRSAS